jgi:hypothetical protein
LDAVRGETLLLINQAETAEQRKQARELAALLPDQVTAGLGGILSGSVTLDRVEVLR